MSKDYKLFIINTLTKLKKFIKIVIILNKIQEKHIKIRHLLENITYYIWWFQVNLVILYVIIDEI